MFNRSRTSRSAPLRTARGSRGFTLLELLVAESVFAVGLLMGVLPAQISAMHVNKISFQKTTAMHIAEQFLENLDNYRASLAPSTWANVITDDGGSGNVEGCPASVAEANDPFNPYHRHTFNRNGTVYYLRWTVVNFGNENMKEVTAVVMWNMGEVKSGQFSAENKCMKIKATAVKYCSLGDGAPGGCP